MNDNFVFVGQLEKEQVKKNKKTIFLDFDGVLHSNGNFNCGHVDNKQFSQLKIFEDSLSDFVDEIQIVFTTSWRLSYSFDLLQEMFSNHLKHKIIGITPNLNMGFSDGSRELEILKYVKEHNLNIDDCIAIDDLPQLFTKDFKCLILCNGQYGFTEFEANSLKYFLSN